MMITSKLQSNIKIHQVSTYSTIVPSSSKPSKTAPLTYTSTTMRARGKATGVRGGGSTSSASSSAPYRAGERTSFNYADGPPGGSNNNPDHFEYTHRERAPGVGQKLSNSCAGLLFGPLLIFLGCLLLWHNEK